MDSAVVVVCEGRGREGAILKGPPSGTVGVSLPLGGKRKDTGIFTVCAGVGTSTTTRSRSTSEELPSRTLLAIKTCIYALHHRRAATLSPYHGCNPPWLPTLHHAGRDILLATGDLWLITSQLPVSGNTSGRHSRDKGDATAGTTVPPGPQPGHYVGVHDSWSGLRT
jgi:hypothetical protein